MLIHFQRNPQVFATVEHQYSDRPFDAMNIWVEEISNGGFVICLRELMTFDAVHSGLQVVSVWTKRSCQCLQMIIFYIQKTSWSRQVHQPCDIFLRYVTSENNSDKCTIASN